jgi:hypothetical protein
MIYPPTPMTDNRGGSSYYPLIFVRILYVEKTGNERFCDIIDLTLTNKQRGKKTMSNLIDFDPKDIDRLGYIYGDVYETFHKSTLPYHYKTFDVYMKNKKEEIWCEEIDNFKPTHYFDDLTNDKIRFIMLWCHQNGHYESYDYERFSQFHTLMSIVRYSIDRMDIDTVDLHLESSVKRLYDSLCVDVEGYEIIKQYLLKSKNFRKILNQ